jgi:hypothetical protein
MEPKPVVSSRQPGYPTRREVLAGAASFALVGLTGSKFLLAETETGEIAVAPIFAHGEGRGATGCIVVSPPVFLSEEEGMQILREELAKHKIQLKAGGMLEGVLVPERMTDFKVVEKEGGQKDFKETEVEKPGDGKPLKLTAIDSERRVAVEFVSQKDYHDLGGAWSMSTVSRYEFKKVAEQLIPLIEKHGKEHIFLGVFYDPLARVPKSEKSDKDEKEDWKMAWEKRELAGKAESQKLLRLQAQDFVAWLKTKKAIE